VISQDVTSQGDSVGWLEGYNNRQCDEITIERDIMIDEVSVQRFINRYGLDNEFKLLSKSKTASYVDPSHPSKGKVYTTTEEDITIIYSYYIEKAFPDEVYNQIDEVIYVYSDSKLKENDTLKHISTENVYEIVKIQHYHITTKFNFAKVYLKK